LRNVAAEQAATTAGRGGDRGRRGCQSSYRGPVTQCPPARLCRTRYRGVVSV
jgi:hypothetical protein